MLKPIGNKFKISAVLFSILILSCESEQISHYERLVKDLTIQNVEDILYRYDQDEYGVKSEQSLKPLFESLNQELSSSDNIEFCINKITNYIDSIQIRYDGISEIFYDKGFYKSMFLLNNKLKNNQLDKVDAYEAINKLIPFIAHEERDGNLYHYPYQIRLYFQDTVYLARNTEYKLSKALLHDHKGRGKQMNKLDRDINYDDQLITINTFNKKEIMKERIDFNIFNRITEEEYNLFDTIVIKLLD